MSNTDNYLTKRLGTVRAHAETTKNEIARLGRQHEAELAELAQLEAALAALDALAEPGPDEDEAIADAIDAAETELEAEARPGRNDCSPVPMIWDADQGKSVPMVPTVEADRA